MNPIGHIKTLAGIIHSVWTLFFHGRVQFTDYSVCMDAIECFCYSHLLLVCGLRLYMPVEMAMALNIERVPNRPNRT